MLARRPRSVTAVTAITCGGGVFMFALALALAGCPTPKSPKGPPPEYEDPPAPSWLADGGSASEASVPGDAGDAGLAP